MANKDHLEWLQRGVDAWNYWREIEHKKEKMGEQWEKADLRGVELPGANLRWYDFGKTDLREAKLQGADLREINLGEADLRKAELQNSQLYATNLYKADLRGADLHEADLSVVNFRGANLQKANIRGAKLHSAIFVETNLMDTDLTGCYIYGLSAWELNLDKKTKQHNLVITREGEPEITVDNIEVAQFVYLLLHNEKIRDVIDTIWKKAVLILGHFVPERKSVLDDLRDELRKHNYLPILFDFDKPASKDFTGTVLTLAHMARFIIADLTDPSSVPYEVSKVAEVYVPIRPILLSGKSEFAMFTNLQRRYHWVLPTHHYDTPKQLIADLDERVIRPAEDKILELQGSRSR